MANDFLQNFRSITIKKPGETQSYKDIGQDFLGQNNSNWKANWDQFNEAIEQGTAKGTPKYTENEINTVREMDNLYYDLSSEFQREFYPKHYNAGEETEMSDEDIRKESQAFIENKIKNTDLGSRKLSNGKTFWENFALYGYDDNLLPDPEADEWWETEDGYRVTGRRFGKIFPFRLEPQWISEIDLRKEPRKV